MRVIYNILTFYPVCGQSLGVGVGKIKAGVGDFLGYLREFAL